MQAAVIAQITHADASFAHLAANFVREVRHRLGVPDQADADVEAEFAAFRQRIDAHYPEFCAILASSLRDQLGPERLQAMLEGLKTEAAQRYLEVVGNIQQELLQTVPAWAQKLVAAARNALANSALSPASNSARQSASSLARAAGIEGTLYALARAVTRQVLPEHGGNAGDPQLLTSPDAKRIEQILLGVLAAFHARLFIRHVGEPHVAAVLAELERGPLRDYLSARSATKPAFERALMDVASDVL
jgi:hypothetical protein